MVFTGNIKYFKVDGNYNGYIAVDSTVLYRWDTDFAMNSGFPNPPTSVDELEINNNIQIYPNPTNGKFTFELPSSVFHLPSSVSIYNILGELVFSSSVFGLRSSVSPDISNQPSGIYFINIISGEYNYYHKLIKQ